LVGLASSQTAQDEATQTTDCHEGKADRYMGDVLKETAFKKLTLPSFIFNDSVTMTEFWLNLLHTDNVSWQDNTLAAPPLSSGLFLPKTVTNGSLDYLDDISLKTFALQSGAAAVQAEADIDNLLLLMAPPYNNLDNLKFGLSILEPIVYRGNVRTEIKENNIGKTVLDIAAEPELDPAFRLRAETGILNSLAKDSDVSGVFKEEMGDVLDNIVFNEQASGENR